MLFIVYCFCLVIAVVSASSNTSTPGLPTPPYYTILQNDESMNYFAIFATTEQGLQQQKQKPNPRYFMQCTLETFPGTNRMSLFHCSNSLYYILTNARVRNRDGVLVYVNNGEIPVELISVDTSTSATTAPIATPVTHGPTSVNITNSSSVDSEAHVDPWFDRETVLLQMEAMNVISIMGLIGFVLAIILMIVIIMYICCCRRKSPELTQVMSSLVEKDPNRNINSHTSATTNIDHRTVRTTSKLSFRGFNFFSSSRSIDGGRVEGNGRDVAMPQSSSIANTTGSAGGSDSNDTINYITNTREVDYYRNAAPRAPRRRDCDIDETLNMTSNHSTTTVNYQQDEYEFTQNNKLRRKSSLVVSKICEESSNSNSFADPMYGVKFGDDDESQSNSNYENTDIDAEAGTKASPIEEMTANSWDEKSWKSDAKKNKLTRIL